MLTKDMIILSVLSVSLWKLEVKVLTWWQMLMLREEDHMISYFSESQTYQLHFLSKLKSKRLIFLRLDIWDIKSDSLWTIYNCLKIKSIKWKVKKYFVQRIQRMQCMCLSGGGQWELCCNQQMNLTTGCVWVIMSCSQDLSTLMVFSKGNASYLYWNCGDCGKNSKSCQRLHIHLCVSAQWGHFWEMVLITWKCWWKVKLGFK